MYHRVMANNENDLIMQSDIAEQMELDAQDETFYCAMETYRATHLQPAEYCENEVEDEGDYCGSCSSYEDGPDPDDARDAWLEAQYDDRFDGYDD